MLKNKFQTLSYTIYRNIVSKCLSKAVKLLEENTKENLRDLVLVKISYNTKTQSILDENINGK